MDCRSYYGLKCSSPNHVVMVMDIISHNHVVMVMDIITFMSMYSVVGFELIWHPHK